MGVWNACEFKIHGSMWVLYSHNGMLTQILCQKDTVLRLKLIATVLFYKLPILSIHLWYTLLTILSTDTC